VGAATAAAVLGCPAGASIIARITLSGTPLAFRFFKDVGAVSKAQALDLILAMRTSAGRPALDISEMSLLDNDRKLPATGVAAGSVRTMSPGAVSMGPVPVICFAEEVELKALHSTYPVTGKHEAAPVFSRCRNPEDDADGFSLFQ
jgi:hypothetical protein